MPIVKFDNGIRVKFDTNPTQSDIDEMASKLGIGQKQQTAQTQISQKSSYERNVVEPLGNVSEGVAKGGLSTLKGLGTLGQTVLNNTAGRVVNAVQGKGFTPTSDKTSVYEKGTIPEMKAETAIAPEGVAQNIGFGAEKIAELFLPASKIAKAEKAADLMFKGAGFLPAAERVVAKGVINAVPTAAVVSAQTGSLKEGAQAGLISGTTRGVFATIGEGARAFKLPERLYSTIFKNSAKDMITELKSGGMATLKENNPQRFEELVGKGIIKVSADGSPILNDTLAEQALDKGLKGSIRTMADEVVTGALNSEDEVQTIANGYKGTISLKEPQFVNVFKKIATEYEDVGFGEIADEANKLAETISSSGGNVTAETAIKAKRFLDRVRIATSFDKPVVNLSTSQGNLKTLADAVRSRVNSIPGMGETMKNYSFYIDALESLAREASRRGNNQVLSLIDSLFLSGAYAGNNPIPGVTMGMIRKLLMSAPGATYLGQALKSSAISPVGSGILSAGSAGGQSLLSNQ